MQADTDWLLQSEAVSIPDDGPSPLPSARSSTLSDWPPGGSGRGSEEVSGSVWGDGRSSRGDGSSRARSSPLSGHKMAAETAASATGGEVKGSPASSASICPIGSSRPSSGCPRGLSLIGGTRGRSGCRDNPAVGPPSAVRTTPSTASAASNISGTVSLFRHRSSNRSWISGWEGTDEAGDACSPPPDDDGFGGSPAAVGFPPLFCGGGRASSLPSELPSHLIYSPPAGTATGNNGDVALEVTGGPDDGCGNGGAMGEGSDGGSEGATGLWQEGATGLCLPPSRQATVSIPSSRPSRETGAGPHSRGQESGASSGDGSGGSQGPINTADTKKKKQKQQGATSELLRRLSSWARPASGSEKEQPEKVKGSDRKKSLLVRDGDSLQVIFRGYSVTQKGYVGDESKGAESVGRINHKSGCHLEE